MLYPSSFAEGSFHFKNPSEHPYAVVYRSIKKIKNKISPKRVRPWLQFFKDYSSRKKIYRRQEIQAQIKAAEDSKTDGWMLWSPSSRYKASYLRH